MERGLRLTVGWYRAWLAGEQMRELTLGQLGAPAAPAAASR